MTVKSYQLTRADNDTAMLITMSYADKWLRFYFFKKGDFISFLSRNGRKTVGQHTSLLILLKSWLILLKNRVWTLGGKNGRSHENVRVDEFELDKIGRKLKLWFKKSIMVYGIEECPAMT